MKYRSLNPLILTLWGAGLLRMSWQKWTNVMVDYGRELYTPWRITCGQVLYKDIASLFGPFPSYWNALLFKVFGPSLMTLALFNILLVAGITLLIYRFFSSTTDRRSALFASAAFLSLFAFQQSNQGWDQGNFSYICPYTYSVTYAVFLSLWAIDLFAAHGRNGRDILLMWIGLLIGLTALCRFEIFVFLAIAVTWGIIFRGIIEHWPLRRSFKAGALTLAGFSIPVGITYLYFSTQLPLSQVWPDILGFNEHWRELLDLDYYKFTTGSDLPRYNFMVMLTTAACYGAAILSFKCLCVGRDCFEKNGKKLAGVIFILLGLAGTIKIAAWILSFYYNGFTNARAEVVAYHSRGIFKGLPIVIMLMTGYLSYLLWKHSRDKEELGRVLPLWVMSVWGLLMIIKVTLNAQTHSEGFVYALPAALLFVVLFQGFVPRWLEAAHPRGNFIQPLISILMVLIFLADLHSTAYVYRSRIVPVGSGSNKMICKDSLWYPRNARTKEINDFLKNIDNIMGKDANFVVFPQGVMLNFLAQRIDPLPYNTFMFAEVVRYGEYEMLRSLDEHRPDYIVLASLGVPANSRRNTRYPFRIRLWILDNYRPVWPADQEIGQTITVYKRID